MKTISQNNQKCNQHIVEAYVHIHNKYKVSVTIYVDRRANQRKVPKLLPFKNYESESLSILCAYMGGHMSIGIPNMKFLCLTMWLGGLYTDNNSDSDSDTDSDNDNDGQSVIV